MTKKNREAFIRSLRAARVVQDVAPAGSLALPEILGVRGWFDLHRSKFTSSGGRPTNPRWTIKRSIPFSEDTWLRLKEMADGIASEGDKVGPGQIAACLLEEAVGVPEDGHSAMQALILDSKTEEDPFTDLVDPEFRDWEMPDLFACVR